MCTSHRWLLGVLGLGLIFSVAPVIAMIVAALLNIAKEPSIKAMMEAIVILALVGVPILLIIAFGVFQIRVATSDTAGRRSEDRGMLSAGLALELGVVAALSIGWGEVLRATIWPKSGYNNDSMLMVLLLPPAILVLIPGATLILRAVRRQ